MVALVFQGFYEPVDSLQAHSINGFPVCACGHIPLVHVDILVCLQEKLTVEQVAVQPIVGVAGLSRMLLQTVQYIFWIPHSASRTILSCCIEVNKLSPFAMWTPLTPSDYYGDSVAILDFQSLALIAFSSVPT